MKKTISRISTVLLILVVSLTSVMAQPGHRHHRSGYRGDGFIRGMRDVHTVANTAMLGYGIASMDDYTGIRFGYNTNTFRTEGFGDISSDVQTGVNLGIVFGWYLGNTPLIIEPGLYYTLKGGKLDGLEMGYNTRTKLKSNMHMFEIPLVFKYEVQYHNAGVCLHPFFGGFLSFGIGGKTKSVEDGYNDSWDTFSDGEGQLGRTDAGVRMGCGLGIDHLFLELAYDCGLVNLASDQYNYFGFDNYDSAIRSNTVSFSIGFNF
ncbi:MAG: PorT family protein [Bacteroidales bacterium]|nr:PorT family protein [Bacteroidales bacterium]